jgi:hypothetical protein
MAATEDSGSQRFYHAHTRADLKPGGLIEPGNRSNYGKRKQASYVYLTATLDAATWEAELALGEPRARSGGRTWASRAARSRGSTARSLWCSPTRSTVAR